MVWMPIATLRRFISNTSWLRLEPLWSLRRHTTPEAAVRALAEEQICNGTDERNRSDPDQHARLAPWTGIAV